MKSLSQNRPSQDWDLNLGPLKYEAQVLDTWLLLCFPLNLSDGTDLEEEGYNGMDLNQLSQDRVHGWTLWWIFGFHKRLGISWSAEALWAFERWLCSVVFSRNAHHCYSWLRRVLVTSEMDNRGLPSGLSVDSRCRWSECWNQQADNINWQTRKPTS